MSPFPFPSSLLKLPPDVMMITGKGVTKNVTPDVMMITGKGVTKNVSRVLGWHLTNDNCNAGQMLQLLSYTGTLGSLAKK